MIAVPSGCSTRCGNGFTGTPALRGSARPTGVSVLTLMTLGGAGAAAFPLADGTAAEPPAATARVSAPARARRVVRCMWFPLENG